MPLPDPAPDATPPTRVGLIGADRIGCLAMAGILLCSTVIGAVIGLPLLLASFVLLFRELLRRRKEQTTTGRCPYCQTSICIDGKHERCACHGCGRALRVVGGQFVPAPD